MATDRDWSQPSVYDMLKAAPMLQWRRCYACEAVGLHVDNVDPWVKCHNCGSMDTRQMVKSSRELQEQSQ